MTGNHDWQPKASAMSSFHLLGSVLISQFGDKVQVVQEPTLMPQRIYCIPHLPNQDMFNVELENAAYLKDHLIVVHANWSNNFAARTDHSLNVSEEQAQKILANGNRMLFGHEHQRRVCMGGNVLLAGNQFPSSISDCLSRGASQADGKKYAHIIDDGRNITAIQVWDSASGYAEVDWQELDAALDRPFLRVVGKASAEQAAEVVDRIAKLRRNHSAFVIGNAVQVDGIQGMGELAETSMESVKSFDVLGALLEQLDEREAQVVRTLMVVEE
jgi:hypothetical protein